MIRINLKRPPELESRQGFDFHVKIHTDVKSHLSSHDLQDRIEQAGEIGKIRAIIECFQQLPCEVNIQISVKQGKSFNEGEINPYNQNSFDYAHLIIEEVNNLIFLFAESYHKSDFTIEAKQKVELKNIRR